MLGLTRVHCEAVGKSPAFTESHSQIRMVRDRQFVLQCEPKPHTQDREASQNFLSKGEPEPHRGHAQPEGPWRLSAYKEGRWASVMSECLPSHTNVILGSSAEPP